MRTLTVLTTLLLTSSAYATDIVRPTPVVAYRPMWTGPYFGLSAGYGWGNVNNTQDAVPDLSIDNNVGGAVAGGFAGYNYQFNSGIVVGVETDLSWANIKGGSDLNGKLGTVPFAVRASNNTDWLGTTRARLGFALGSVLVYGTGGLAYGGVSSDYVASIGSSSLNSSFAQAYSTSSTQYGWTAGLGAEYLIGSNLTLRSEWLYYDLGNTNDNLGGVNVGATHRGNLARVGVAWKF